MDRDSTTYGGGSTNKSSKDKGVGAVASAAYETAHDMGETASDAVNEQINSLKSELASLKESLADATSKAASAVSDSASAIVGRSTEMATAAVDKAKSMSVEVEEMTRRNPLPALAGAVVIGMLIGMASRGRH